MPREYSTPIELRFADLDLYNHVNNVVYFSYLETARVRLFQDVFRELTAQGILLLVGKAECEYRLPILYDDPVVVTLWIARIGTTSFDIDYRIHDGGNRTFALARTVMVCFDSRAKRTTAVPESLRRMAAAAPEGTT